MNPLYSLTRVGKPINVYKNHSLLYILNVFDSSEGPQKFILDTGASTSFINPNVLKFFHHSILNNLPETIILADGSTLLTSGVARVSLNLPNGKQISLLFKILPSFVYSGLIGSSFLSNYDITSERRLRHIRSGMTIPFKLESINTSEGELCTFASTASLTPRYPDRPKNVNLTPNHPSRPKNTNLTPKHLEIQTKDRNKVSLHKSADFALTLIEKQYPCVVPEGINAKAQLFSDHPILPDQFSKCTSRSTQVHEFDSISDRDLSPEPLRDKLKFY